MFKTRNDQLTAKFLRSSFVFKIQCELSPPGELSCSKSAQSCQGVYETHARSAGIDSEVAEKLVSWLCVASKWSKINTWPNLTGNAKYPHLRRRIQLMSISTGALLTRNNTSFDFIEKSHITTWTNRTNCSIVSRLLRLVQVESPLSRLDQVVSIGHACVAYTRYM